MLKKLTKNEKYICTVINGSFSFDSTSGDVKFPEDGVYGISCLVAFFNDANGFSLSDVQSELRLNGTKVLGSDVFTQHISNSSNL